MAKDKIAYVCSNCGQESTKWIGKCPNCGEWNTFKEIKVAGNTATSSILSSERFGGSAKQAAEMKPIRLKDIPYEDYPRIDLNDKELNRVLGGGLVPGSLILLGGEPGIGKSTLTLQTILNLPEYKILYVSGEESAHQLKMRARRLESRKEQSEKKDENVIILCETSLDKIIDHIQNVRPEIIIIDSIQTIHTDSVDSGPGSVSQVRECAATLLRISKSSGIRKALWPDRKYWNT